jgi:hypothetical protein
VIYEAPGRRSIKINHMQVLGTVLCKVLETVSGISSHPSNTGNSTVDAALPATVLLLLLQTTAHFMFAANLDSSCTAEDSSVTLPVTVSLELAQQVSKSGLLPQLAEAASSAAQQLPCAADLCIPAALLQLCLAVARMWPQGSLKSAAAGALAAPTARLAVGLMRESSAERHHGVRQQPIVAGSALFALQMVQLSSIKPSGSPPAPHLQQLQESSDFLWLVLLVLDSQMQQQQAERAKHPVQQQQQQQQQQAAAALLGTNAHQLWQQQHFWRQHSSADDLSRTLKVLQHLLKYWNQLQAAEQQQQEEEAPDELAGPGLQLLQHLPVQLLQLAGMNWGSCDMGSAGPASTSGQCMPGLAALDMLKLALSVVLPCPNQWDVFEAVLQQWTQLFQQLLPDSCDSIQAVSGREAAGTSSTSVGASVAGGAFELQTHSRQPVPASASAASSSAAAAGLPASSGAAAGSVGMLLPEFLSTLSDILYHIAYTSDVCGSSSSSSVTNPAAGATASSSSSSITQRVSCVLQATAAAERCARALAAAGLAADAVVDSLYQLADCCELMYTDLFSRVQAVLLPTSSREAEHALQLMREAQLLTLYSIVKALPMNRSAYWAFADGAQQLLAVSLYQDYDTIINACLALSCDSGSSSSSSSSAGSRLGGGLSVLVLLARWLRVCAVQLQFACNVEPLGSLLQQAVLGIAGDSDADDLCEYICHVLKAADFLAEAVGYAATHISRIVRSCSDAHEAPSASSNTTSSSSSSSSSNTASSSSSSSSSSNTANSSSSSNAVRPLEALERQLLELHSCACSVGSGLDAACDVSTALADHCRPPETTAGSDADGTRPAPCRVFCGIKLC